MVSESTTPIPPSRKKPLSHHRKQIYLQIIAGIIILVCGVVIGSGITLLRLKDKMIMRGPRPPLPAIIEDIQGRYDLTREQVEKVEGVLGKRRETMHSLFEEFRQKTEAEFQKISIEMKEILSPEQYERWEKDFKFRRERGPGRFGPGRAGPGKFGARRPDRGRFNRMRSELSEPNSAPE